MSNYSAFHIHDCTLFISLFLIVYLPWEGVDTTASIRAGAGGTGSVTEDGKFNVDAKALFDGSRILASNTILFIVRA